MKRGFWVASEGPFGTSLPFVDGVHRERGLSRLACAPYTRSLDCPVSTGGVCLPRCRSCTWKGIASGCLLGGGPHPVSLVIPDSSSTYRLGCGSEQGWGSRTTRTVCFSISRYLVLEFSRVGSFILSGLLLFSRAPLSLCPCLLTQSLQTGSPEAEEGPSPIPSPSPTLVSPELF